MGSTDVMCMHIVFGFVLEPHVRDTDVTVLELVDIDCYSFITFFEVLWWSVELYPIYVAGCICQCFYKGWGCSLLHVASFMALAILCPSPPIILNLSTDERDMLIIFL